LVEDTLQRLARVHRSNIEHWVYLSEPLVDPKGLEIPTTWTLALQSGSDLGGRLESAFREAFQAGRERMVVLGSDSPTLPLDYVGRAFDELAKQDAVLGPAEDGGYYLVGCSTFVPGITWGSDRVFAQSTEALSRAGRRYELLPVWYDIDSEKDLVRLRKELHELETSNPAEFPRRTARVLAGVWRA
jgi:rSAM/selenodomain-associated transferase 1